MNLKVREGQIAEAVWISQQIPEFFQPYAAEEYERRFAQAPALLLIAEYDGDLAGFKAGYALDSQVFYSWMGAVRAEYRQQGIAQALADAQEQWAYEKGYQRIRFKTRNRLKGMLHFALGNGFNIVAVEAREEVEENRILLEKEI
jgi:ribosomal protein S18 acetylase RimI-like enzyme